MPLYEYQCEQCGNRFERIHQKFSDPPVAACPSCGGPVKKLLSSPAIQFKGSGWYITDYAKKPAGDAAKPAGDTASKTDAASDSKSDSSDSSSTATTKTTASETPAAKTAKD